MAIFSRWSSLNFEPQVVPMLSDHWSPGDFHYLCDLKWWTPRLMQHLDSLEVRGIWKVELVFDRATDGGFLKYFGSPKSSISVGSSILNHPAIKGYLHLWKPPDDWTSQILRWRFSRRTAQSPHFSGEFEWNNLSTIWQCVHRLWIPNSCLVYNKWNIPI